MFGVAFAGDVDLDAFLLDFEGVAPAAFSVCELEHAALRVEVTEDGKLDAVVGAVLLDVALDGGDKALAKVLTDIEAFLRLRPEEGKGIGFNEGGLDEVDVGAGDREFVDVGGGFFMFHWRLMCFTGLCISDLLYWSTGKVKVTFRLRSVLLLGWR